MMKLPSKGLGEDEVFDKLTHFADGDMPWRAGKTLAYIYDGGADVERVAKRAYTQYLTENALDPTVYPSLARMERELIAHDAPRCSAATRMWPAISPAAAPKAACWRSRPRATGRGPSRTSPNPKSSCRSPPMPPSTRAPTISA